MKRTVVIPFGSFDKAEFATWAHNNADPSTVGSCNGIRDAGHTKFTGLGQCLLRRLYDVPHDAALGEAPVPPGRQAPTWAFRDLRKGLPRKCNRCSLLEMKRTPLGGGHVCPFRSEGKRRRRREEKEEPPTPDSQMSARSRSPAPPPRRRRRIGPVLSSGSESSSERSQDNVDESGESVELPSEGKRTPDDMEDTPPWEVSDPEGVAQEGISSSSGDDQPLRPRGRVIQHPHVEVKVGVVLSIDDGCRGTGVVTMCEEANRERFRWIGENFPQNGNA